jgi:hypothetical protein
VGQALPPARRFRLAAVLNPRKSLASILTPPVRVGIPA